MLLRDRTAIVYGGSGAVGGAVAKAFAREGARVFLAARTLGPLQAVADEIVAAGGVAEVAPVDATDPAAVEAHLAGVVDRAGPVKVMFNGCGWADSQGAVLTDMTFPKEHRAKLHSTNPIERLNDEIKRRTDVVGIFPNDEAIIRLVGAILLEQNDEWAVQRARYMTLQTISQSRRERWQRERQASVNNPLGLAVMVSVLPAVTATSAPELSSRKYPTSGLSLTERSTWTTATRTVMPAPEADQMTGSQVKLQVPPLRVQATVMAAPPAV